MTSLYRLFVCLCLSICAVSNVLARQNSTSVSDSSMSDIAFGADRLRWFRIAQESTPVLKETVVEPVGMVRSVRDSSAFQGWRMESAGDMQQFYTITYKKGAPAVIIDFGRHVTGYFSFSLHTDGWSDAPTRFRFTFGEVPAEVNTPFDPYTCGLSRGWLQDEIVTVMTCPEHITVPIARRMAFRYVKIELLGVSASFQFNFSGMQVKAVSSASGMPMPLADETPDIIKRINTVGLATLSECMQTVYEDGPKRDLRLWIGDLYLEALANSYSFKNHDLTKRCLYLLASLADSTGWVSATVFERPEWKIQGKGTHCMDYSLLYGVALRDYVKHSGDTATGVDLWPLVKRQIEVAREALNSQYVYDNALKPSWLVFDWKGDLNRDASIQGLMIFALEQSYDLARMLSKEKEVSDWPKLIARMKAAARETYYDRQSGLILSGPNKQASYLSQVWMVLSGTLSAKEGARALTTVMERPDACYIGSPYAYHYLIEALIQCGLTEQARTALIDYWGGMVRKGADTFWEVYDPNDEFRSPYGFYPINSYCHAWSCTPVYFINKYPEIFQRK